MPAEKVPAAGDLDNDDYPAYTMGRAADILGTTPAFLRAVGGAGLIAPLRSEGGHRRYSRSQLRIAARARELVDQGTPVEAACRIISLEDRLDDALRLNRECADSWTSTAAVRSRIPSPAGTEIRAAAGAEFLADPEKT